MKLLSKKLNNKKLCRNRRPRIRSAISIVEVMVFIVVLVIAVIGTSGYRYYSTLDICRSDNEIAAGRIAALLCESWKGIGGGDSDYNPITDMGTGLNIEAASSSLAPEKPLNFTLLKDGGHYKVVTEKNGIPDKTFYATMSFYIINSANGNLETLNVTVNWVANENMSSSNTAAKKSLCLSDLLITH